MNTELAIAVQRQEFQKAAQLKAEIDMVTVGGMRSYAPTPGEEIGGLKSELQSAVAKQDYALAAELKVQVEECQKRMDKEEADRLAKHHIEHMSSNPAMSAAFLDGLLGDEPKKKRKKKKKRPPKDDSKEGGNATAADPDDSVGA